MQIGTWTPPASVHAAKSSVLDHIPDATAFFIGDGEWNVVAPLEGQWGVVIGAGVSLFLAWSDACHYVERVA